MLEATLVILGIVSLYAAIIAMLRGSRQGRGLLAISAFMLLVAICSFGLAIWANDQKNNFLPN